MIPMSIMHAMIEATMTSQYSRHDEDKSKPSIQRVGNKSNNVSSPTTLRPIGKADAG